MARIMVARVYVFVGIRIASYSLKMILMTTIFANGLSNRFKTLVLFALFCLPGSLIANPAGTPDQAFIDSVLGKQVRNSLEGEFLHDGLPNCLATALRASGVRPYFANSSDAQLINFSERYIPTCFEIVDKASPGDIGIVTLVPGDNETQIMASEELKAPYDGTFENFRPYHAFLYLDQNRIFEKASPADEDKFRLGDIGEIRSRYQENDCPIYVSDYDSNPEKYKSVYPIPTQKCGFKIEILHFNPKEDQCGILESSKQVSTDYPDLVTQLNTFMLSPTLTPQLLSNKICSSVRQLMRQNIERYWSWRQTVADQNLNRYEIENIERQQRDGLDWTKEIVPSEIGLNKMTSSQKSKLQYFEEANLLFNSFFSYGLCQPP